MIKVITNNVQESMDDFIVWKLVSETDVVRLGSLYEGSKKTDIVFKGKKYYRKLLKVHAEPSIDIFTNWY